jgi:hypothetical protein
MNHSFEMMDLFPHRFEFCVIVRGQRLLALSFEFFDLRFDGGLVEADHLVVLVHVYAKHVAQRWNQMVLVHNAVALKRVVIYALGNLTKLGYGLALQIV